MIIRCSNMTGVEYRVVHRQLPILYIIRKQYRQSPEHGKAPVQCLALLIIVLPNC